MADDVPGLRHGYTLADVDNVVRMAVNGDLWHRGMDIDERVSVVRLAVLEALYAGEHWPAKHDLVRAGRAAVDEYVRKDRSYAGHRESWGQDGTAPRWVAYWWTQTRPVPSCEAGVVERRALVQIWPRLSDTHRQVLAALAAHGDYAAAATALGKTYATFVVHVNNARREFRRLWHEHETPRGVWGTDRRADRADVRARRSATAAVRRRTGEPRRVAAEVHDASRYRNQSCRCVPCTTDAAREAREKRRAKGAVARRRVTEAQLAGIRARRDGGESLRSIAADLGFSDSYLSRLLSGVLKPAKEAA